MAGTVFIGNISKIFAEHEFFHFFQTLTFFLPAKRFCFSVFIFIFTNIQYIEVHVMLDIYRS